MSTSSLQVSSVDRHRAKRQWPTDSGSFLVTRSSTKRLRGATWGSESNVVASDIQLTLLTWEEIDERASNLFYGESASDSLQPLISSTCISARLFACFSLACEKPTTQWCIDRSFQPLIPLMSALVYVEMVALWPIEKVGTIASKVCADNDSDGDDTNHDVNAVRKPDLGKARGRTTFSGFDLSSMQPPVDRVDGSAGHLVAAIQALLRASDELRDLATCLKDDRGDNSPQKAAVIDFLQFLQETASVSNPANILSRVNDSENCEGRRLRKAAAFYRDEMAKLSRRFEDRSSESTQLTPSQLLVVEQRLAELNGQAIRYWLRRYFNKAPPRLTPADKDYDSRCERYSKVCNLIQMTPEKGLFNNAVSDEYISALVSTALKHVYEYFGGNQTIPHPNGFSSNVQSIHPSQFCLSAASPERGVPKKMTEDDLLETLTDIHHATTFLVATRACRFLLDLFMAPGVNEEIDRQGGWNAVETLARTSSKYSLFQICPQDAHLILLRDVNALLTTLSAHISIMEPLALKCRKRLSAVRRKFQNKSLLRKFPNAAVVTQNLNDGRDSLSAFPQIRPRDNPVISAEAAGSSATQPASSKLIPAGLP